MAFRLRFAGYAPPDTSFSRAARRFKQLVEQETGGRIAVDLFWNVVDFGYGAGQLAEMVDSGLLGGCYMSTSYLIDRAPLLGLLDLPFLVTSRRQAYAVLDGPLGAEMARQLEANSGLKHLGYWESGFRHLSIARRPVRAPADLVGLRIRIQPNALHERAFRLLGAEPVLTDVAELARALRDGRADGQENPLENLWMFGIHELTPYLTLSAHLFGARGMYLNRAWFERLPADLQAIVMGAAERATVEQRALCAARDAEVRTLLDREGLEVVELTPEERQAFRNPLRPLYDEAAERLGRDTLDRVAAAAVP